MPDVYWVKPPSGGAVPYEQWRDDASCNGLDTNLFELGDPDVIPKGDQEDLIAQGLRVCSGCPVRAACKTNSSDMDRYWTTRGGQPPEGLFMDSKRPRYRFPPVGREGGFKPGQGPVREPREKCKQGHSDWVVDGRGTRRCRTCKNRQANVARDKRVAAKK